jgi:predicted kinase
VSSTGYSYTELVVLRGSSGSGKTTTALALRPRLGEHVAWIEQDYLRRTVLSELDRGHLSANVHLVDSMIRLALDHGFSVIAEGIFNPRDYADVFRQLASDHAGRTLFAAFDLPFEETLVRHATKPVAAVIGENEMRAWYRGWDPLPFVGEYRIRQESSLNQTVGSLLAELRR